MLIFDPRQRLTAQTALQHPFFSGVTSISKTITSQPLNTEERKEVMEDEFGIPVPHQNVDELIDDFDSIGVNPDANKKKLHLPAQEKQFASKNISGLSPMNPNRNSNVTLPPKQVDTADLLSTNFKTQ